MCLSPLVITLETAVQSFYAARVGVLQLNLPRAMTGVVQLVSLSVSISAEKDAGQGTSHSIVAPSLLFLSYYSCKV